MTVEELLAQVKDSSTDLTRIIEAAERSDWPCVVVSSQGGGGLGASGAGGVAQGSIVD